MAGWAGRTAIEIASAVRSGDVTARVVVAEHLDRIASLNAELGAFVRVRSAQALREASEIDARADRAGLRLAGVPVAIKDNLPVAGEPMRLGSAAVPDDPQDADHPVVARLRAVGAVVVPAQIGADSWGGMAENGPLATTVADAALLLEVMAGTSFDLPGPSGLRIAVSVKPTGPGIRVHRSGTAAVRQCGDLLASLGHTVTSDDPAYPSWSTPATIARWFTCPVADAQPYLAGSRLERRTRRHVRAGQVLMRVRPPRDTDRERLRTALGPFFDRHDVLVMPSLGRPCPTARRRGEEAWLRSVVMSITFAPMTGIWNLAGFPAASVPTGACTAGLPGSVQLVAAPGREDVLLALAAQLERARGWPRHAPSYDPGSR